MIIPSKLCRAVGPRGKGAIGPQDLGKYATDFLKDGRRIGQFGETRITTG